MSAEHEFEQEWEQVKRELSNLKGYTVFTPGYCHWNTVEDGGDLEGLRIKTKHTTGVAALVKWGHIKERYRRLYTDGIYQTEAWYKSRSLKPSYGRGAFCRAVFSILTTGEVYVDNGYTGVRYVRRDDRPRLKPQEEWPCQEMRT